MTAADTLIITHLAKQIHARELAGIDDDDLWIDRLAMLSSMLRDEIERPTEKPDDIWLPEELEGL